MDAAEWDARYAASELVWSAEPNQFVAAECGDLAPGRAVDLAAGEGRNAIWLAGRGWQVVAVDFSRVALDKGRRLAGVSTGSTSESAGVSTGSPSESGGRVEWVWGDATTWRPAEPVDLVVIAYLQLPAAERRAAVRGGFESLRPGGTLLLVAHDSTNLAEGTGGPQDAAVLMSAEDVLGDLDGLDLRVVRAGRVPRDVAPGDDHRGEPARTAWDCLVRVERR